MFLARPPVLILHHEYFTYFGCNYRKLSTHPFYKNYVKLFRYYIVNPAVFSFPFGFAMSIYLWQTFKSPQIIVVFFFLNN